MFRCEGSSACLWTSCWRNVLCSFHILSVSQDHSPIAGVNNLRWLHGNYSGSYCNSHWNGMICLALVPQAGWNMDKPIFLQMWQHLHTWNETSLCFSNLPGEAISLAHGQLIIIGHMTTIGVDLVKYLDHGHGSGRACSAGSPWPPLFFLGIHNRILCSRFNSLSK